MSRLLFVNHTPDELEAFARSAFAERRKAAILDELIDQAATICAIICNADEWVSIAEACASIGATSLCAHLVNRARFGRAIDLSFSQERCERWAEAEARLRNGECFDLLIGGGE